MLTGKVFFPQEKKNEYPHQDSNLQPRISHRLNYSTPSVEVLN